MINKQHVGDYFFNTWSMYHCLSQHRSHGPIFDYFQIIPFTDICTAKLKTTQQIQTNRTRRDQSEEGEFRQL